MTPTFIEDTPVPQEAPDLMITKEFQGQCLPGSTASFRLTVQNVGLGGTSGDIVVTDSLPNGLTLVSAAGSGWDCSASVAPSFVSCKHDGLTQPMMTGDPPLVITVIVNVLPPAAPVVVNTATVSTDGDLNTANNTDSDVCTSLPPAPAPLLSPNGMLAAGLALLGVSFVALRRRTRGG